MNANPWNWDALSPEEAAETWRQVYSWVKHLVERYELYETVPSCWWRHRAITEELTALWAAWNSAYGDPFAETTAPVKWHESFATARERIENWNRLGCASEHREPEHFELDWDDEEFSSFVDADAELRQRRPPLRRDSAGEVPFQEGSC